MRNQSRTRTHKKSSTAKKSKPRGRVWAKRYVFRFQTKYGSESGIVNDPVSQARDENMADYHIKERHINEVHFTRNKFPPLERGRIKTDQVLACSQASIQSE